MHKYSNFKPNQVLFRKSKHIQMRKIIYFLFAITILWAGTSMAQKKAFAIEDLYKIHSVGAPVISPDRMHLAFTVTDYDLPKGKSLTDIYVMDLDGSNKKQITNDGKGNSNPLWTSDSKCLYYVSSASGTSQVYIYTFAGNQSKKITDFSMGVNSPVLSPDNKLIAFSSEIYPECGADSKKNAMTDSLATNGPVQAYVADQLLFRHWTDYAAGKASHIILYNIKTQTYTDLTPDKFISPVFMLGGGIGYNFSPDSKELCYVSNHDVHPEASTNADLFVVSVTGGEAQNITLENKAWDGSPTYSPDGKFIAYRKQLIPGYESDLFRLAFYNRQTKATKMISESFDNWVNDYKWNADSKSIYFLGEVQGHQPLYKIEIASQKITPVSGEKSIFGFDFDTKGYVYYSANSVGKPSELYRMKLADKKVAQLTTLNQEFEKHG